MNLEKIKNFIKDYFGGNEENFEIIEKENKFYFMITKKQDNVKYKYHFKVIDIFKIKNSLDIDFDIVIFMRTDNMSNMYRAYINSELESDAFELTYNKKTDKYSFFQNKELYSGNFEELIKNEKSLEVIKQVAERIDELENKRLKRILDKSSKERSYRSIRQLEEKIK